MNGDFENFAEAGPQLGLGSHGGPLRFVEIDEAPGIEAKLRYLQSTLAPAGIGEPIRRIETCMSWLLLDGDRVLKLKKPVRFPFLDFTTVQARERNAHAELRVNRRLAPHVYLGLLALQ